MENHLEFYPSPPVLLTNEQAEAMRKLNLGSKPQPIHEQLSQRPGVIRPGSGLTTSQRNIEQVQAPPAILLRDNKSVHDEPKSTSQRPKVNSLNHARDGVPDAPPILTQTPKSMPKMKYNNFVYVGGEQYDKSS